MNEGRAPFELLKTHPGLIHLQPLFQANRLNVDSYHLTFLTTQGEKMPEDTGVPDFVAQLPVILASVNHHRKALLTIPESWQHALENIETKSIELTLEVNGHNITPTTDKFNLAGYAHLHNTDDLNTETLLIDVSKFAPEGLIEKLPLWRQNHQTLCATNVNSIDQYYLCQQNGLDLLQGIFYTLPDPKNNTKITPATQTLMELLVKLQEPEVEAEYLANTINRDVTLSYKLLRLINSAFFGMPREVSSTKQAIVMLGQNKIKTWASLLCLSGMDDKPNELRRVATTRARMCELLAKHYRGLPDMFFAAGLFSTLDALLDKPLDSILERLPLSTDLMRALLEKKGPAGRALQDVLNYECGDWQQLNNSALPVEVIARVYLDALHWSKELNQQLHD